VFSPTRRFRTGFSVGTAVRHLQLDNGMKVALKPDATDPVVAVSLLFHGGAVLDPPGLEGLSHLTAETLERGTSALEFVEFSRRFERIGSSFSLSAGAELAHGSATALSRHAETMLGLVADALEDPGFRAADLDVIRTLALSDLAAREDDLDDVAEDQFLRGVAHGHPYAQLPQGTEDGLRAIDTDALRSLYAEAYRPDRAHLAIVGDFSEDAVLELLRTRFGSLPVPATPRAPTPWLADPTEDRVLVTPRAEKGQARIFLGGTGFSSKDDDRLAGIVMNRILGSSSIRSRLGDELRDNQGLAYSVYSRNYERSAGGFFLVHMGTRPENVEKSVVGIRNELRKMTEGVTAEELDDAKAYLTGSFPLRFTTYGRLARFWTRHSFYEWPDDYLDTYIERVRAIEAADVRRAAERIVANARVLAVAGPVGADLRPLDESWNG
jgi:zinc protease